MGRTMLVGFLCVLALGCSTRRWEEGRPRLRLTVDSRVSELPATLQFSAFIEGGRNDEPTLYCPDVVWDFQDVVFRDQRDCEPYAPGKRIQRAYTAEQTFEHQGTYDVEVRLLQRGTTVLRARIELQVRSNSIRIRDPNG